MEGGLSPRRAYLLTVWILIEPVGWIEVCDRIDVKDPEEMGFQDQHGPSRVGDNNGKAVDSGMWEKESVWLE